MSRAIVITSGKGGVGKSSLSVCVGRELAKRGKKTVLIDTDVGLNNLDVIMNVENRVVYDLHDVMKGKCRLSQALTQDREQQFLFLLSSKGYKDSVPSEFLKRAVTSLITKFDYVFIDCPAGIDGGFHTAVAVTNEAIVVTTPHVSSIKDASIVIDILKSYSYKKISYVLNRVRWDMVANSTMAEVKDVTETLDVPPIAVIPECDAINTLSTLGSPLRTDDEGDKTIKVLCDNIEQGTNVIYDMSKKYKGFLGAVRRIIKNKV